MKPKGSTTCNTLLHDKNHEDSHVRHNLFNNDLNLGQLGHKKNLYIVVVPSISVRA